MATRFAVDGTFTLQTRRFSGPLRHLERRIQRFTGASSSQMRALRQVGAAMRTTFLAGLAAIVAMGAAAAAALREVINTGMEFDRALAQAGALFGNIRRGTEEFERLEEAATRVGISTEFSSSQAAEGLGFLAMAGFNAEQAVASLAGVVDLATSAQLELAEATDIASDILGNQGLMSEDADQLQRNLQRVNDVLARTSTTANTDVREMFEAFRTGGATAHGAGASIETTAAIIGTLANAGVKGAEAGTSLRTMFTRLVNPSRQAQRALRRLHVDVADGEGNVRDMVDILGDLQRELAGRGTAERGRLLGQIFGARGVNAANILLEAGSDHLREYRTSLENANGAAAEMAETMRDTAGGDLASMNSAIEGLKLQIWDVVRGPVRSVIQAITEWVRANQDLIASGLQDFFGFLARNMDTIRTIAIALAVVFVGLAVIFAAVFAAVMILVLAIPAAIAGVVAAVVAVVMTVWDTVVGAVQGAAEAISSAFTTAWNAVRDAAVAVGEFMLGLFVLTRRALNPVTSWLRSTIQAAAAWVREQWAPIGAFFGRLWGSIRGAAAGAWSAIVGQGSSILNQLRRLWQPIGAFFSGLWNAVRDSFLETFGEILTGIGDVIGFVRTVGRNEADRGKGPGEAGAARPQLVTREERVARTLAESVSTTRAEVSVRAEPGTRAEVTRRPPSGSGVTLAASGAT